MSKISSLSKGLGFLSSFMNLSYKRTLFGEEGGDLYVKCVWFEAISSGTSGTITKPENADILLDQWDAGVDALTSTIIDGVPNYDTPKTAEGSYVTATLDTSGAWTFSGSPVAYPVALVYSYITRKKFFDPALCLSWTEYDGSGQVVAGEGIPSGGAQGSLLRKKTGLDYDTEWVAPAYVRQDGTTPLSANWSAGSEREISVGTIRATNVFADNISADAGVGEKDLFLLMGG